MPSRPIFVKLWMQRSTSSSIIPSTGVTQRPSMAIIADRTAVETPLVSFIAQLGFAPSQIMPVRLAIMFFTAAATWS